MESLFQQAANQKQDQPATPATPASTPAAPAGSMDQMFQQAAQAAPQATAAAAAPATQASPKESWIDRLERKAYETVGKAIPQAAIPAMALNQKYLANPIHEADESIIEGAKDVGRAPAEITTFFQNLPRYAMNQAYGTPQKSIEEQAKEQHPIMSGVGEGVGGFAGQFLTPTNMAIMVAMPEGKIAKYASALFTTQMAAGVKDEIQNLSQNWDKMSEQERAAALTQLPLQSLVTLMSAMHTAGEFKGEPKPEAPKETPKGEEKRTLLRPTTKRVAGQDVPISAIAQENPSIVTKAGAHIATPGMAETFRREETAPAATKALVSTLSQSAEDSINAHKALMAGQAAPEPITGTDQMGKYDTVDQIAQAAKATSEQTYQHADQISQREVADWEARRDKAIADHKAGIDQHNSVVDQINSSLGEDEEPAERVEFNPDDVKIPNKPKTYNELKSELDQAQANSASSDAAVREKAFQSEVPKAEKALDKWFQDHSDEITPAEYQSARRLRADAENYQTMANSLRSAMNKESITRNTMKQLEATIDNKAIRRGQAPGQFQRLLGPDGYANWNKVADLFAPVKDAPSGIKSWGQHVLEYAVLHMLSPMGLAAKVGAEFLMNRIMFNSAWGSWFSDAAAALKNRVVLPQGLKDRFNALMSSERGAVGRNIKQGSEPQFNKFGRAGLGGAPAEDAGLAQEPAKPTFELSANGEDESGNKNHILAINRDGDTVGHLNISQVTPDSWQVNDAVIRKGMTGQGLGKAGYEEAFRQAAQAGMKTVESDISMTSKAKGVWESLRRDHPDAITEENGQYTADVAKLGYDIQPNVEQQFNQAAQEAPAPQPVPQTAVNDHLEIGTRRPSTAGASGENNPAQQANMSAINEAEAQKPGYKKRLAESMLGYENSGFKLTPEDLKDPHAALEKIINHLSDNLVWLHNQIPEHIRGISKQWYDSAHQMTAKMAERYGIAHEKMAAVVAALSPKNGWDNNVGQADRLVDHWVNHRNHEWSPEMDSKLSSILSNKKLKPDFADQLKTLRDKTYDQLTAKSPEALLAKKGLWLRLLDEAHNGKQTPVYAPDGSIRGHQTLSWGMPDPVAKAIAILEGDGSIDHINSMMGEGNKIRNFYNNIINPNSERGHVTIDTHAVNADMLKPMGSNDPEVLHNFGGAPGHAGTGLSGSYALHAEAYERAARQLGLKPRELQSITWEGVKSLMGDEKKTPKLKAAIKDIWKQHEEGTLSLDDARKKIIDASGGFTRPPWLKGGGPEGVPLEGAPTEKAAPAAAPVEPAGPVTDTPAFKNWFGESKVVDDEGNPQVVYHGTTHDISEFKPERGNRENAWGKGYYFTDNPTDASENYAGIGPDLKSRIEGRAEQIQNERYENDQPEITYEKAKKLAQKELVGKSPNVMPTYLKMENPVDVRPKGGTEFTMEFDPETEEESGSMVDLYNAIQKVAREYEGPHGETVDGQKLWDDMQLEPEGVNAFELQHRMANNFGNQDIYEPGEFLRRVFQEMGFDGIKQDAHAQFGKGGFVNRNAGGGMEHVTPGTHHYIIFDPKHIKSAIGNKGTFNPNNPSIISQKKDVDRGDGNEVA